MACWRTANFRTFTSSTGITRGQEDSGAVRHGFADEEIFLCTGKKNTSAYTLPTLLWIKHNHPDIWERAYKFLMSMDYLTAKLTGQCVTDCSKASGTLFYNSFTGVLKERTTDLGVIIDVDKITAELGGNPLVGGKAELTVIRDCIDRNISFTQETTLSGYKTEATAKEVKALGYHIRLFYVGLDTLSESLLRIDNRVKRGGHNIPKDDVQRRFSGRWKAVAKVLPYCDEAEFYDNDNGFVKVAEYCNGELRTVGNHVPDWLSELQNHLKP